MKAYYSTFIVKKFSSKDKVVLSDTEIYSLSEDPSDQEEIESLKSIADNFAKQEFLNNAPAAKVTYFIEFNCDILKGGKVKKVTDWVMKKYTQEEMGFVDALLLADKKIMGKYERQELEPEVI